jgi:hypothetical protein
MAILLLICVVAGFTLTVTVSAATSPGITGHVRDQDNRSVQQAIVTLYFNKTKADIAGNPVLTDANGNYKIANVPSNIYSLQVEKNSYTYAETVMVNETDLVMNFKLPGHTAALVTTPSPVPTPSPAPSPSPSPTLQPSPTPSPTPSPSPTAKPSPGFEVLIGLAGIGLAIAARKR